MGLSDWGMPVFWLILCVAAIGIELGTVALVSVWFAIGAFCAMAAALWHFGASVQWIVFALVSLLALLICRKKAVQSINGRTVATNADRVIGREGRVTETIDNARGAGQVVIEGQVWTARSETDGERIEADSRIVAKRIEGVKLIVARI